VTLVGLVLNEISYHGERTRLTAITTWVGLGSAWIQTLLSYRSIPTTVLSGAFAIDGLSVLFKLLFISGALLTTGLSWFSAEHNANRRSEFSLFLVAITLGSCLAVSSTNFLLTFVALQLVNAVGFFLVSHAKRSSASAEAAMKFLLFSVVSGFLFLLGAAILFSYTKTANMADLGTALAAASVPPTVGFMAFVLFLVSFCFYLGAFPMYLWAPDVLEGAPISGALTLLIFIPTTGLAILLRFFSAIFSPERTSPPTLSLVNGADWLFIIACLSGTTMLIGALLALRQNSAKRMIACLWVTHAGFLLMGFLVLDRVGVSALIYNLVVDVFCLVGLFSALSVFSDLGKSDSLDRLKEVVRLRGTQLVPECVALLVFLSCFVGFPPFPGYIGRFALIGAAIRGEWWVLVVIWVIAFFLSVGAFARFAFSLVGGFSSAGREADLGTGRQRVFLYSLMLPLGLLSVFADQILSWAGHSLRNIFW
jgi:NADH-quinone oxidoreductase subunit N